MRKAHQTARTAVDAVVAEARAQVAADETPDAPVTQATPEAAAAPVAPVTQATPEAAAAPVVVLAAVSGGTDSLALAVTLADVAAARRIRAGAVVVDHQLQDGSAAVAARAAAQCRDLGLDPVEVIAVNAHGTGGPEAAAREARYRALEQAAHRHGARSVLLAHTLDDQAETVLLAMTRGSGLRALAGMPQQRGIFIRPWLDVTRETTAAICDDAGLAPWQDPTNDGENHDDPLRSRLRASVMPVLTEVLGRGAIRGLARTARIVAAESELLDTLDESVRLTEHLIREGYVDVHELRDLPPALRGRAIRALLLGAGAPAQQVTHAQVTAVDDLVLGRPGRGPLHIPGGLRARVRYGRLEIYPFELSPGES